MIDGCTITEVQITIFIILGYFAGTIITYAFLGARRESKKLCDFHDLGKLEMPCNCIDWRKHE